MLLDLLLPPGCAACDETVSSPGELCGTCFARLNFIGEPACQGCGLAFSSEVRGEVVCESCAREAPPWGSARAALLYDEAARGLILPFKNADRTEIADVLAFHMQRVGRALLARAEVLVPVPLHRWRLLRRRYNQSALIARALARRTGVLSLPDGLARVKATASLGRMSAVERSALLMGSIRVRPRRLGSLTGKRILLIDDVLTSGATARACTRALLDAGAASIDVLVASRVADPRTRLSGDGRAGAEAGAGDDFEDG